MRINPVNVDTIQYYSKPQKSMGNSISNTSLCKSNDVAFTGNFFTNLRARIDSHLAKIAAKAKNLPGSYDDEFNELLKQARYGDGVPLIGNLRDETISSNEKHKKAIKEMIDSTPTYRGDSRGFLQEALQVIEEKMNPKKID